MTGPDVTGPDVTGPDVTGPDRIVVDRFDVANAAFWLDHVAGWLDDPGHPHQRAEDLRANAVDTGPALTVIVGWAAAALRGTLTCGPDPAGAGR